MISHEKLTELYPNIAQIGKDGVLELFCDNHILSSMRACQMYFTESILNSLSPRVAEGQEHLSIGIWFHKTMEPLYKNLQKGIYLSPDELLLYAKAKWEELNCESFAGTKAYDDLGGFYGAMNFISDYYEVFSPQKEHLKIISSELTFGYDREVLIEDFNKDTFPFRAFLVGRPDVIVEGPLGIGPLDFKTVSRLDKARDQYKPYDALTGYVFATDYILKTLGISKPSRYACVVACQKGYSKTKSSTDRFQRIHYTYTNEELEEYRLRMKSSFLQLYRIIALEEKPTWNTMLCNSWYFRKCPYHVLHSSSPILRESIITQFFEKKAPWNPKTRGEEND